MDSPNSIWEYGLAIGILVTFFIPLMGYVIKKSLDAALSSAATSTKLDDHRAQVLAKFDELVNLLKDRDKACGAEHNQLVESLHALMIAVKESITLQTFISDHFIKDKGAG
jgi:hypothetical protein